jgi:hypothetical protein
MKSDIYGQSIFTESDLCLLYLQDPLRTIKYAFVEKAINFNDVLQLENNKYYVGKTTNPKLMYEWKSITEKYNVWIDYMSNKENVPVMEVKEEINNNNIEDLW